MTVTNNSNQYPQIDKLKFIKMENSSTRDGEKIEENIVTVNSPNYKPTDLSTTEFISIIEGNTNQGEDGNTGITTGNEVDNPQPSKSKNSRNSAQPSSQTSLIDKVNDGAVDKVWRLSSESEIDSSYIKIYTPEDLLKISENLNAKYILMADIDMSGYDWTPIGTEENPFSGRLDGNGHTIKNLNIKSDDKYVGMFGYVHEGELYDITLENATVVTTAGNKNNKDSYAGVLAGYVDGFRSQINHCHVVNSTVDGGYYSGLLIGGFDSSEYYSFIENCSTSGTIKNAYIAGGVVGKAWSWDREFRNIHSTADITASYYAGGLFGKVNGCGSPQDGYTKIENCSFNGKIVTVGHDTGYSPSRIGGIAGFAGEVQIENCDINIDSSGEGASGVFACYQGDGHRGIIVDTDSINVIINGESNFADFADPVDPNNKSVVRYKSNYAKVSFENPKYLEGKFFTEVQKLPELPAEVNKSEASLITDNEVDVAVNNFQEELEGSFAFNTTETMGIYYVGGSGNYYVWNPWSEEFLQIEPELNNQPKNYINKTEVALIQAYLQNFNFTKTEGIFEKNGKYYEFDYDKLTFVELNLPVKPEIIENPINEELIAQKSKENVPTITTTDSPYIFTYQYTNGGLNRGTYSETSMPGVYEKQGQLYVWDATENRFLAIYNLENLNDKDFVKNNSLNVACYYAHMEGYSFTEVSGIFEKNGEYFKFDPEIGYFVKFYTTSNIKVIDKSIDKKAIAQINKEAQKENDFMATGFLIYDPTLKEPALDNTIVYRTASSGSSNPWKIGYYAAYKFGYRPTHLYHVIEKDGIYYTIDTERLRRNQKDVLALYHQELNSEEILEKYLKEVSVIDDSESSGT